MITFINITHIGIRRGLQRERVDFDRVTVFRVRFGVQRPDLQMVGVVREDLRDRRQQVVRLQQHLVVLGRRHG